MPDYTPRTEVEVRAAIDHIVSSHDEGDTVIDPDGTLLVRIYDEDCGEELWTKADEDWLYHCDGALEDDMYHWPDEKREHLIRYAVLRIRGRYLIFIRQQLQRMEVEA